MLPIWRRQERGDGRKFRSALLEILPSNPQVFQGSHDRPMAVPAVIYLFEDVRIADIQQAIQGSDALELIAFDAGRMGWSYRTAVPPTKTYAPGDNGAAAAFASNRATNK